MEQLQQLELLAETLYNPTKTEDYKRAVEMLQGFSTLKYIPQCKFIMDNSKSQFAILFASSSLLKAISANWNGFNQDIQHAFELRNYLLSYLWNKYSDLQLVTLNSIVKLLSHVTKLSWLTDERHADIVDQVEKFLTSSVEHRIIGLQILIFLIEEFSTRYTPHSFAVHRKISNSFRDTSLLKSYEYAVETLTTFNRPDVPQAGTIADQQLEKLLAIIIGCLSYDFLGTTIQSSNEDMSSIQIPASWKPKLEDGAIVTLIFDLYTKLPPPRSTQALECMSLLASIRTSLFQYDKKNLFLSKLMSGMSNILQKQIGLTDPNNHHQFCRVLARLKANYPLNQLYSCEGFQVWLQLVCDFTCTTFMAWQWSPNSVLYLLGLWHRFLTSIAHLKSDEAKSIPEYSSRIAIVYLYSKLDTIQRLNQCEEDLLEDEEQLQEQLDAIPSIARCKYAEFGQELTTIIDPLFQQFQSLLSSPNESLSLIEGKLAWIIYIIGSVISGRLTVSSMESTDAIDADLAVYAFQILAIHDRRLPVMIQTEHIHHLEMSLLSFLNHFRRIFIDKSTTAAKVFTKLHEKLGIETQQTLLELILRKIITNLNYWKNNSTIITKSLTLFNEILGGYASCKILPKMEIVNMILSHHTVNHFPFLGIEENFRNRTIYYQTLGQLLFMNNFHTNRFDEFMTPFRQSFELLCNQPNMETLKQPEFKKCLIGLLRDLIGIVSACHTRQLYEMFFEWVYPKYIDIIAKSAAIFYDQPDVTSPLLRFAIQMASNKRGRLNFECSSANGILLFRELSKIVMEYGRRIYDFVPVKDVYAQKLKGIYLTLTVITKLSSGNYIPFGVFELYGDPVLTDSLTVSLKLALSIKKEDLMTHPKLTLAYFQFICSLCQYHTKYLLFLDAADFNKVLSSIKDAISTISVDAEEFHQSCLSLEHLATFFYNNRNKDNDIVRRLKFLFSECAEIFSNILGLLLHLSMFDTANNWEISKTIITLIVINPQQYQLLTEEIINNQPQERRAPLSDAFKELMTDVELNLELQNKEVFSKNLVSFRASSKKILFCD